MMHNFAAKLAEGARGEAILDALFSGATLPTSATYSTMYGCTFLRSWEQKLFKPIPVSSTVQRTGIDRYFTPMLPVEYKTDARASQTHNAFIETVSVDTAGKLGWAYTSRAHVLVYYIPDDELVYVVRFSRLRARLGEWLGRYPERQARNDGYVTKGVCIPLVELERCADATVSI